MCLLEEFLEAFVGGVRRWHSLQEILGGVCWRHLSEEFVKGVVGGVDRRCLLEEFIGGIHWRRSLKEFVFDVCPTILPLSPYPSAVPPVPSHSRL